MDCLDALRSNVSFLRSPLLYSPPRDSGGRYDHFCSSTSTTRKLARLDVNFSAVRNLIGLRPIGQSTGCPIVSVVARKVISGAVTLCVATNLSDEEKLGVLRRLDQFRKWYSLEEKRYCLVCGKLISGRQIQVTGGTRSNGPLRLSCPTERCNSIPMDWVLPTDEILANVENMAAQERKAAELKPVAVTIGNGKTVPTAKPREDLISRLLKFVLPFKRYS